MDIGGLQKCSLIDYPGEVSAIIFTRGCNFRCPYCYNSELVLPEKYSPLIPAEEIFSFLEKRRGKLDAVAITGGEPCIQPDLPGFIRKLKKMGYKVKIDTNGSCPGVLEKVLPLVDYIAMDVKAPPEKYSCIAGADVNIDDIKKSIRLIINSGKEHEFRTTVFRGGPTEEDFRKIGKMVEGAKKHYIQNFLPSGKVLSEGLESCSDGELEGYKKTLEGFVGERGVR